MNTTEPNEATLENMQEAAEKVDEEKTWFDALEASGLRITEKQKQDISEKINDMLEYQPAIGLFGKTGAGKSSLCNALFGQDVCPIDDVAACTRDPQSVLLNMGCNGIKLIDVPGVGESAEVDEMCEALYTELLPKLDMVLWLVKADDRATAADKDFYERIVRSAVEDKKPVFLVLTQVDKMEPFREWNVEQHEPGATQFQNIHRTATATHGERPRGSCIITGEAISGSYSSLLRCLLVPISRGDIDGTLLSRFQAVPELWCSNFVHFLRWSGEHWDDLVNKVKARFPVFRKFFTQDAAEPRLIDSGVLLQLTGEILLDYGVACGAIDVARREEYLCEWQMILCNAVHFSASLASEVDLVSLCREALSSAQETGSLRIAASVADFQPGMDGFLSADRLWLRQDALLREMRKKSVEMSASCAMSAKAVLPELYNRGLILRDEESGKNSYLKRTPIIPALGKRSRMLCFDQVDLNPQP